MGKEGFKFGKEEALQLTQVVSGTEENPPSD